MGDFQASLFSSKYLKILFAVFLLIILAFAAVYQVSPGEVGVIVNKLSGNTSSVAPGWHIKKPILDSVYVYNVKTQLSNDKTVGASKDLQEVTLELQTNFRPIYEKVSEIHVKIGIDYYERVIKPAIFESAKSAIAKYNAEEMMIHREELRAEITSNLINNLKQYNINIENVNIRDIDFKEEFNKAVEAKVVAQQNIKTAEYRMEQAKQEKAATILQAEGEAKRQELLTKSASKDSISLAWISKWDGSLPKTVAGANSNFIVDLR